MAAGGWAALRHIVKQGEPHALLNWKRENRHTPENLHYAGGGFPRETVREALLAEQHYLCAYTLRLLKSTADCHIEHILPQSRGIVAENIDYSNMLACHPAANTKTACEFGAQAKADYDPGKQPFCSPLRAEVETVFRFREDGEVEALAVDATATIEVLRLNHPALVQDRQATVQGWLRPGARSLSAAQARRLAQNIRQPDGSGRLQAYCEAVAQVAIKYAEREEKRAACMRRRAK